MKRKDHLQLESEAVVVALDDLQDFLLRRRRDLLRRQPRVDLRAEVGRDGANVHQRVRNSHRSFLNKNIKVNLRLTYVTIIGLCIIRLKHSSYWEKHCKFYFSVTYTIRYVYFCVKMANKFQRKKKKKILKKINSSAKWFEDIFRLLKNE